MLTPSLVIPFLLSSVRSFVDSCYARGYAFPDFLKDTVLTLFIVYTRIPVYLYSSCYHRLLF